MFKERHKKKLTITELSEEDLIELRETFDQLPWCSQVDDRVDLPSLMECVEQINELYQKYTLKTE